MALSLLDVLVISFSAFGLTYGLVSGYRAGVVANQSDINLAIQQGKAQPEPVVEEYYGQHSGLKGPFNLYDLYRRTLDNERMPSFVRDGATCRICLSMWTALWFSVLNLFKIPATDFILTVFAVHGILVFVYGWVRAFRGIAPNDW